MAEERSARGNTSPPGLHTQFCGRAGVGIINSNDRRVFLGILRFDRPKQG